MARPRPDLARMQDCVCTELRRASRLVTQRYDAALRPFGLRATQLPILVAAEVAGPVPLAALSARLGMERTTLLRNLRPLTRQGLVRVDTAAGSTRGEVHLTRAGRALLERVYPAWEEAQLAVLRSVRDPGWKRVLAQLAGDLTR